MKISLLSKNVHDFKEKNLKKHFSTKTFVSAQTQTTSCQVGEKNKWLPALFPDGERMLTEMLNRSLTRNRLSVLNSFENKAFISQETLLKSWMQVNGRV
jgi:predicted metal-dependent hydrolase